MKSIIVSEKVFWASQENKDIQNKIPTFNVEFELIFDRNYFNTVSNSKPQNLLTLI